MSDALGIAGGAASVLGTSHRTAPRFAALLNAAAMHADNFDDTNPQAMAERNGGIHATAPVLAAALAMAEEGKASGRDLATALHAGIEIACRINHAIDARHYQGGFHATGTLSTFGAAAAAAMLRGMDRDRIGHALAFAASATGGVRQNFGSMVEILHPGLAAEAGVLAADLAGRGSRAPPTRSAARWGISKRRAAATIRSGSGGWAIPGPSSTRACGSSPSPTAR